MPNIQEMNRRAIIQTVKNSHIIYSEIIKGLKNGALTPTIQAKHQRVYIRKANLGEKIFVEADNASYTATENQYLVYNDPTNAYLVDEKAFKKYELDENMEEKTDKNGLKLYGYKSKGAPVLVIEANKIASIDLKNNNSFTYFPSNWWGSTDTVKKDFIFILPYNASLSLAENIKLYEESFALFPQPIANVSEIKAHLTSGKGFDCYAIHDQYVSTYAICDKNGTFKDPALKAKAGQTKKYLGQPNFSKQLSK